MRYSKKRNIILDLVRSTDSHPTADWVYERVRENIVNISLGTVYRNLKQLVDNNLVRSQLIHGVVHYDGNMNEHQHFYCTLCGQIYDLEIPFENIISSIDQETDHKIQDYDLLLNGVCNKCQKNE